MSSAPLRDARLRRLLRDALGYQSWAAANRSRPLVKTNALAEAPSARFTPDQASLLPRSITPLASCGGCVFYRPDVQGAGSCYLVEGPIQPEQVCSFFSLRGPWPAWARIGRASLQFGRGPPGKAAPVHAWILQAERSLTTPKGASQLMTLTSLSKSPMVRAFLHQTLLASPPEG